MNKTLQHLKEVSERATKGPWYSNCGASKYPRIIGGKELTMVLSTEGSPRDPEDRKANATFCKTLNPQTTLILIEALEYAANRLGSFDFEVIESIISKINVKDGAK